MRGKHALIKIPVNLLFLKMQSLNNSRKGQVNGGFFKSKIHIILFNLFSQDIIDTIEEADLQQEGEKSLLQK